MQAYLPQLPQSEKPTTSTLPNFPKKLPSKSQKPLNASSFPLKCQRVYPQTSKRFKQNVKEFSSKRKGVSDKTQRRFSILFFLLHPHKNLLSLENPHINSRILSTEYIKYSNSIHQTPLPKDL